MRAVPASARALIVGFQTLLLAACGESSKFPEDAGIGANPTIPEPNRTLIPTVNIAPAKGWSQGAKPKPAEGLAVNALASGLDHPRWLHVLPNGDVLVAETSAPERPEDGRGIRGFFYRMAQKRAGSGVPSANRITLLRDADGDGVAETRTTFLQGSTRHSAWRSSAATSMSRTRMRSMRFPYKDGATQIARRRREGRRSAGRTAQSSLDQEPHCEPRRLASLCGGRLEQQRRRERSRQGGAARGNPGDRSAQPATRACSPRACAIRSAWRGTRRPASCGRW